MGSICRNAELARIFLFSKKGGLSRKVLELLLYVCALEIARIFEAKLAYAII